MLDFLDEITLGLSPQDFLEDMEVEDLATAEDHEALESPDDQALQDLAVDKWPFQLSGDRLLGASQLCVELSDQSSSADEAVEEGLLDDLRRLRRRCRMMWLRSRSMRTCPCHLFQAHAPDHSLSPRLHQPSPEVTKWRRRRGQSWSPCKHREQL